MTSGFLAAVVAQGIDFIESLDDELYRFSTAESASIGQHYRHIVDHFWALQAADLNGLVDYEQRHRGGTIEYSRSCALEALQQINRWGNAKMSSDLQQPVTVRISTGEATYVTTVSSFARELLFVCSHAIHHYAFIATIAQQRGQAVPASFGLAPSTCQHKKQLAAAR